MNGFHHAISRLKKFASATVVISLGTWVYHVIQSHYEIRYSKNVALDGSKVQLNVFNSSANPALIHVSFQPESGGVEDLMLRMHPQSQQWSLREMLPAQETQLNKFSNGTILIKDLDYLADRHRKGGLETLRQKLLTNLRDQVAEAVKSQDITKRFMQLPDKHADLAPILPRDVQKTLGGKLENVYSRWERDVTQLFGGLAASWRTTTDTKILFPEINLSKTGPVDLMLTLDGRSGINLEAYSATPTTTGSWNIDVHDKEKPAYRVAKDTWLDKNAFAIKYFENPLWGLLWFPAVGGVVLMFYFLGWPKNLDEVHLYNSAQNDESDEEIWTEMRRRFTGVEDYLIRRLLVARAKPMPTRDERTL